MTRLVLIVVASISFSEVLSAKKIASTRTMVRTVTKTVSPKGTTTKIPPNSERQPTQQKPLPVPPPVIVDKLPSPIEEPPDLFKMVRQKDLEGVSELLADEFSGDINARNTQGDSALHIAASLGDLDMVRLLTDHGAEVMLRDNLRRTASQRADRHPELKNFLQEKVTEKCRYRSQRKRATPERKKKLAVLAEQEAKRREELKKRFPYSCISW